MPSRSRPQRLLRKTNDRQFELRSLASVPSGLQAERIALASVMLTTEFLGRLEHHLATRLAELDVKAHPSSDSPRRLTRQWTLDFVAAEAAKHREFANLAALLRNIRESGPELGG